MSVEVWHEHVGACLPSNGFIRFTGLPKQIWIIHSREMVNKNRSNHDDIIVEIQEKNFRVF